MRDQRPSISDELWVAWLALVQLVTSTPVCYGPGRGAFDGRAWIIKRRAGVQGADFGYHGFVCSTWTNFVLGFLTRRGALYTHTGGMPALFDLCELDNSQHLHPIGSGRTVLFRGYGPWCKRVAPEWPFVLPLELFEMRRELPAFLVAGSSTVKRGRVVKWWHHTCVYWIDHGHPSGTAPMWRIAADGSRGRRGFSRTPMNVELVHDRWSRDQDAICRLRVYGVVNLDTVAALPIYPVELEELNDGK